MIKRVNIIKCDKCKKTVNCLYKFNIQFKIIDATCEDIKFKETTRLEYCKDCFCKMLEKLGLEGRE